MNNQTEERGTAGMDDESWSEGELSEIPKAAQ